MMNILPLNLISETDQPIFGAELFNLAKLQRAGLPVFSAIAITAPEIVLNTVLKHILTPEKEVFEQKLTIIKKEMAKIALPSELIKELGKQQFFYLNGQVLKNKTLLWKALLGIWLEQLRTKIWRDGFGEGVTSQLQPQAIFFIEPKFTAVTAFFDPQLEEVVIKSGQKIEPKILQQIDQLVLSANKKLFFPQVYTFLISSKELGLIALTPFTQSLEVSPTEDIVIPKNEQQKALKSAVKLFLNLSSGFTIENNIDGVLVEGGVEKGFDETVFRLAEAALSFPGKPIIFKLADIKDGDVSGSLRLINQKSLLDGETSIFLFVRNKKNLLNIELAIPLTRSSEEFLQIKRELAAKEITRKGSLKFWLEVAVPENVINIQNYLDAGLDGVILDVDRMQKFLGGYEIVEGEFYRKQVQAMIKFLQPFFSVLHKVKIPVLVKGTLSFYPEMLDFLIEAGVWGIVANSVMEAESASEHLRWAERRMVSKRLS